MSAPASGGVRPRAFLARYITPRLPHRVLYRLTGGRLGARLPGTPPPVLLLTVTGRHSGSAHDPARLFRAGGDLVVIGSNSGYEADPQWSRNLHANPVAEVQIGAAHQPVRAREAQGEERAQLWAQIAALHPVVAHWQAHARRRFPAWVLDATPS